MKTKDKIYLSVIGMLVLILAAYLLEGPEVVEKTKIAYVKDTEYIEAPADSYTVTAYCACRECCGEYADNRPDGIVYTASGAEAQARYTIAAPLPFGTKVYIEGMGVYEVQDRTADYVAEWYDNRIIDIYCDTHDEAVEIGKSERKVYILEVGDNG